MKISIASRFNLKHLSWLLVITALFSNSSVLAEVSGLGNNEETFVFAGRCASGESYRLVSYMRDVNGVSQSHYDYDGPVGKGTVRSETYPKVMAVRVCLQSAEIINAHYWE